MTRSQFLLASLPGLGALLLGIGLARFGYTPLIPALIGAAWLTPSEAVYLGAMNLMGYLAGSLLAAPLARHLSNATLVRSAMLFGTISFAACALNGGFWWFAPWRFVAGFIGAVLMVLAVPLTLGRMPENRRGRAVGIVFTGVGIGVAASGTLVPLMAASGVGLVWALMAVVGAAITFLSWTSWAQEATAYESAASVAASGRLAGPALLLLLAYALDGIAFVPHSVFWSDFIARELGRGLASGGGFWVLFGIGALCGPMLAGLMAEKLGFNNALLVAFGLKMAGLFAPLMHTGTAALAASSLIVGAFTPGISALMSGRMAEVVGLARHKAVWGWMTTAFALMQAAGGYGFSYLFSVTHSYQLLFALGGIALAAGGVLAALTRRKSERI